MDIRIDKFTPCLEKVSTGQLVNTSYSPISTSALNELKGWNFKWADAGLKDCEIFRLTAENDARIQGLVAVKNISRDNAVYVKIAESAPHNIGKSKEYRGVGGHLFAIAVKRSVELGYNGFIYMDAKNLRLVSHYAKTLGAIFIGSPHPYRMAVDEIAAKEILSFYSLGSDQCD